jgi:hypothetical protein
MGCAASVKMFYGVCYEYDSPDGQRIQEAIDAMFAGPTPDDGSPASLYWHKNPELGIALVPYGHMDLTQFGIGIYESVVVGKDWMPLSLHESQRLVQVDWINRIIAYANKHGLTINSETRFGYWIVPYYG